jgi:hypothetical protein
MVAGLRDPEVSILKINLSGSCEILISSSFSSACEV